MSSPRVTFNLTCGKGVTKLQNLTNLRLSSFAESHQMQQRNFDISPKVNKYLLFVLSRVIDVLCVWDTSRLLNCHQPCEWMGRRLLPTRLIAGAMIGGRTADASFQTPLC